MQKHFLHTCSHQMSHLVKLSPPNYRPQTKLREGNVFRSICLSMWGGGHFLLWTTPPPPPPNPQTAPPYLQHPLVSTPPPFVTGMHSCILTVGSSKHVSTTKFVRLNPSLWNMTETIIKDQKAGKFRY